jgi:hypothetical protein
MKKILILSAALALAGLSTTAMAAEGQGFIRGELGNSHLDVDFKPVGSGSDNDTAAIFAGGYWFNPNFAIEGRIGSLYNTDLGNDREADLVILGAGVVGKQNFGADNTGFYISGHAGIARMTAQERESGSIDVIDDESSTKLYYGVGVGYDFSNRWGMGLNYDRYTGSFSDADVDVDAVTLSGEWRF